jgi:hypothetical protein
VLVVKKIDFSSSSELAASRDDHVKSFCSSKLFRVVEVRWGLERKTPSSRNITPLWFLGHLLLRTKHPWYLFVWLQCKVHRETCIVRN